MAGRLSLVCARVNGRSALTSIRFDGLARASRALREPGGGVRVVVSMLGPGLLAGDRVASDVEVGSYATLVVASQMATPIFSAAGDNGIERVSRSESRSRIARGAALYALGEPLLPAPGAVHEAFAEVDVADDGFALLGEIVVLGKGSRFRARTTARIDGRLAVADACDLVGREPDRAYLTAIVVTASDGLRASLAQSLSGLLPREPAVRAGFGATGGGIVVRARANGAWPLQRLLQQIAIVATAARAKEAPGFESERSA